MKAIVAALLMTVSLNEAYANDCGWSQLSATDQSTLTSGESVMRHSTDADGIRSHIDQWMFSSSPSLVGKVANFYDESEFKNSGGVADISLADGQLVTNNPVIYNVVPKSGNPFGKLYQPFSYAMSVSQIDDAYNIQINYLSSPGAN